MTKNAYIAAKPPLCFSEYGCNVTSAPQPEKKIIMQVQIMGISKKEC